MNRVDDHQIHKQTVKTTPPLPTHIANALKHSLFLYQAARTLNTTLDTDEILQQLMNLAHQHFVPDAVSVALVAADGTLHFRAASGEAAEQVKGMSLPAGAGIIGWVAEHKEALWVPDVSRDPRFCQDVDQETGFTTDAIYAVPVLHGDDVKAVLEMINPPSSLALNETQEIMNALAALAASAIRNAELFEKVSTAEARYQRLFDLNADPIVVLDADGRMLEINQAAQKLLPLTPQDRHVPCLQLLDLSPEKFTAAKESLKHQKTVIWESTFSIPEGNPLTLEINLTRLPYYGSEDVYQWDAHDITERVELEELREQLTHMIVHDLRSPLSIISNSLELAHTAWEEQDLTMPLDQILIIAARSAKRMERLISNILDTARLRSSHEPLAITNIELPPLIQEIEDVLRPSLQHRQQQFQKHLAPDLPPLRGDRDLLQRALINVLDNAVKFTPPRGNIELHLTHTDAEFRFMVHDSGSGIAPEDRERIFELYVRGQNDKKTRGAGIGLAFCKLAVEAHGGHIWVADDDTPGATMVFTIPKQLPDEALLAR